MRSSARSTRGKIPLLQLVVSPNRERCLLFGFYLIFDAISSGLFLLSGKMKTPKTINRVHSPLTSDHAVVWPSKSLQLLMILLFQMIGKRKIGIRSHVTRNHVVEKLNKCRVKLCFELKYDPRFKHFYTVEPYTFICTSHFSINKCLISMKINR